MSRNQFARQSNRDACHALIARRANLPHLNMVPAGSCEAASTLEGAMSFYLWFIRWLSNSLIDTFRIPEEWDPIVQAVCFFGLPFVLYWSVHWLVDRFYNSGRQNQPASNVKENELRSRAKRDDPH